MSFLIRFFDNFIQKETLAQVFSCEFCQIIKNTFLFSAPLVATSFLVDTKQIYPRSGGNNWTVTIVGGGRLMLLFDSIFVFLLCDIIFTIFLYSCK